MVRSHIARHIAARGLVASQGIFHHSELNGFNLADDLIEPYRAVADLFVLERLAPLHIGRQDTSLTRQDRQMLVDILNYYVIILDLDLIAASIEAAVYKEFNAPDATFAPTAKG